MKDEKYKINYFNKLSELHSLYESVKKSLILGESFDEKREMCIAPINQLRSALDHIFKSIPVAQQENECDYELKEAKEHMERAGYDALEVLAGNLGTIIITKLTSYDTETLSKVFPDYFTKIKPKITAIKLSVTNRRMERRVDAGKTFFAYFEEITELININEQVDMMIPSLQEYKEKKTKEDESKNRKEHRWQYLVGPMIGFVSAGLIALLTYFLSIKGYK